MSKITLISLDVLLLLMIAGISSVVILGIVVTWKAILGGI
jgi:hypothetical protein